LTNELRKCFETAWWPRQKRCSSGGLAENKTAMQALGYRQVMEYLRGERSLAETVELVKTRTRQFAKRQTTWFRRQMKLNWIDVRTEKTAELVAIIEDLVAKTGFSPV